MTDVDALTRILGKFISQYCIIASILYSTEKQRQPKAYEESIFTEENIVKNTSNISKQGLKPMLALNIPIKSFQQEQETNAEADIIVEQERQG